MKKKQIGVLAALLAVSCLASEKGTPVFQDSFDTKDSFAENWRPGHLSIRSKNGHILFPEGGGVIVLDDPLTDMDEDRVEQSCGLIRECAKRHQVIFLTCREEYQDKLQGNLIRI